MPSAAFLALPLLLALAASQAPEVSPAPVAEEPAPRGSVAQYNASLVVLGAGAHDVRGWSGGAQLALRPELILGRRGASSLGAGPFLEVGAHLASRGVAGLFGAGASLLVPLGESNALVPSFGGYGTYSEGLGFQPGLSAGLFFGARQFNDKTHFDGAWGLRLDVRYGLGSGREVMATLGLQLDLSLAAFLLSWSAQ